MIFLNPTVLFGLLASSIPVIIHFLNLRKIKKVEFSTLTFLKELQKSKIKKIKIKQWLLLLLRVLIILFLVSSFARPTLESVTIAGAGSVAKTTAVLVLDDSYSMSVVDETGSHFNHAKNIISDLFNNFIDGDEVFLIKTSDSQNYKKIGNKTFADNEIRNSDISYVSNPLDRAIHVASSIINSSQNFNKEVYVFSDLQTSTSFSYSKDTINNILFDDVTKFFLFRFETKSIKNLAIGKLKPENQILELNKEIKLSTTLSNNSQIDISDVLLSIFLNGEINSNKNISVSAKSSKLVTSQTTLKSPGNIEVLAELEEDDVQYDNQYYGILNIPESIRILLFSEIQNDTKYLEYALNTSSNIFDITTLRTSKINSTNLAEFDCVFLVGTNEVSTNTKFAEYINDGGRVVVMPGSREHSFQDFTNLLGITGYSSLENLSDPEQYNAFNKIDYEHPLFQNIFEDASNEIESPKINSYIKNSPGGIGQNIIELLDGSSFLSEFRIKAGTILIFNVAPTLSWSDAPLKSIFAPLINRVVYYLASNNESSTTYHTGENIEISVANIKTEQLKVVRPGNEEEYINFDKTIESNLVKYGNTDKIGVYKFFSGNKLIKTEAVNINLIESDFDQHSSEDFQKKLKDLGFIGSFIDMNDKYYKVEINKARFGSELWKLFLVIALLLVICEMFRSRSAKKDLAEINT